MPEYKQETHLEDFTQVRVEYGISARIIRANAPKIIVESEARKFFSAISVVQNREVVEISRKRTGIINDFLFWRNNWNSAINVTLFAPHINCVVGLYGSRLEFAEIEQRELKITLDSGASGEFNCADVDVMQLRLSSGSSCQVTGTCDKIVLHKDHSSTLEVNSKTSKLGQETIVEMT